ncbi:NADPH:quinone oxidoreductase family protein [Ramlibacter sp. G-1-2-2]|uniref:NADPH:quinone oxidoreductase family protein n=1 Tax=Ramlibacter agri TaxID=2728837 RepID=A0A848H127_9BURK|nr:NADPH:quinone oxidoreductase family protein [Ramlibacter agri]NML43332.1 NADPH:quinone oxidoreductase family protein [Ramlibacter agri]
MKALLCRQFGHYRDLDFCDVDPPALQPGHVRIAVHYATAGYGQTVVIAGKYQRKPPLPFVPGTEASGVVLEAAPDVTAFKPGDRVAASLDWGAYGEQAVATAATTWHVPDAIPLEVAATVPLTYGTAYAALHWRARLQPGETVLVYGAAGGVGLPAVEIARLAGARVIAVAGSAERAQVAREHGAHEVVVHRAGEGEAPLSAKVLAATGGRKVDVVFDPVGGSFFDEALRCIRPEGRIVLIGFASNEVPRIPGNILLVKNAEVIGFWFGLYLGWGQVDERAQYQERLRQLMDKLFAHVAAGDLKPTSSVIYPLPRLADAFDEVLARRAVGRALVQVAGALP